MVAPKPLDPRQSADPAQIAAQVNEVLSRPANTLKSEAANLEEAHRILNEALS
ncbi:hypothetical protein SFC07_08770 [Corynebacterium callunae]|uniref:hypothetical protein n=1 Tax=Corynebacterium callunae TaxID=1721 RepID=UPI003982552D